MADPEDDFEKNDVLISSISIPEEVEKRKTESPVHNVNSEHRTHPQAKSHKVPVQIDLSKVKTKTRPHSRPSLPTPLTEYGLDEKKQARSKARLAARALRQQREKTTVHSDDEKDKEKEKQREEKYLNVLDDLSKLRNYYYQEYKDMLDTKVEKQRKDIRTQNEAQQKKEQEREEKKREATHHVKKRHERHRLQHNDNYLKKISKSDAYLILGLQEKMVKEGKLKSQDDLDTFWMEMRTPEIFISHFPNGLAATSGIHTRMVEGAKRGDKPRQSLSQINESKESSRPTTRDTWAVTQRFHHIHLGVQKSTSLSPSKEAALELERRFPKFEMPELHCFTLDLGEKPPDLEQIRLKTKLKIREKQRRHFLKKLHKMHQLAMANGAAAIRILDRHTDLGFLREGPQLTDLISDFYWEHSHSTISAHERLPPITTEELVQAEQPISRENTAERQTKTYLSQHKRKSEGDQQLVVYQPIKPLPLTMEEIGGSTHIVEAKTLSTFWTNYMHAGKRVLVSS